MRKSKNIRPVFRRFVTVVVLMLSASTIAAQATWMDVTGPTITNPTFDSHQGWTWETSTGTAGIGSGNMRFWSGSFNFHQTIEGLPEGHYRLSVQSFYRDGASDKSWEKHLNGTESMDAYLYAGNYQKQIVSIFSESLNYDAAGRCWTPDDSHYYPDGRDAAALAFEEGLYWNTLEFDASGTLTIGIRCDANTDANYSVSDNFKLEYLGTPATAEGFVVNEIMAANVGTVLSPAINFDGWVELYNPTDKAINLGGLYVSDDEANLERWQLPITANIPAKGYKVIWFGSNDIRSDQAPFKLDCDGGVIYFSDEGGQHVISQAYPMAMSRTAYARKTNGGSEWSWTSTPTPGKSNLGSSFASERLDAPVVNTDSRLFTGTIQVTVDIPEGATLMYTTDGSTPTAKGSTGTSKESKTGKFSISSTSNYTFRLFQDGYLPSVPVTRSYIRTSQKYTIPVISIVGDERYFSDPKIGINCDGDGTNGKPGNGQDDPRNYNMPWDRPVNFSYITPNGKMAFNQDVNISVSGGWTRSINPRSMKLKSNKVFDGQNRFDYAFFPQKPYIRSKTLLMRNGGNDVWNNHARFTDAALQTVIQRSGIDIDVQSCVQIAEYINGQFCGILNLREPNNDKFVYANLGYDDEEIDMFENEKFTNGTDEAFKKLCELGEHINEPGKYDEVKRLLDVDEFTNYMATELYLGNDDWPENNVKAYRSQQDGRFRFVCFDLDYAFNPWGRDGFNDGLMNHQTEVVKLFLNLLNNDEYRRKFIDTFCILAGSTFEKTRATAIVNELANAMRPMSELDGYTPDNAANKIKNQLTNRLTTMMNRLQQFSLMKLSNAKKQTVTLSTDTDGAQLFVNGINVPYASLKGTLFAPVRLEAKTPAGYQFAGWKDGSNSIVSNDAVYDLPTGSTVNLTATFTKLPADELAAQGIAPVRVNEVSAANSIYVNDLFKRNDWFELYNTTDQKLDLNGLYVSDDIDNPMKYQIQSGNGVLNTIIPARGHRIVWADELEAVTQLHANFKLDNSDNQSVIVCSSDAFVANNKSYFQQHPEMNAFADGLTYVTHRGDHTVGRYPDGGRSFYLMYRPTIDYANYLTSADQLLGQDDNWMELGNRTFTLDLAEGWNWISHPLPSSITPSELSAQTQHIVAQTQETHRDPKMGMVGSLKELEAGQLYKVQMKQADNFTSTSGFCRSNLPVMLHPGWNWIGYPVNGTQTLTDAFADYIAEDDDMIVGQNGFATFKDGSWTGSLTSLETGTGYLLFTRQAKTLCFRSPKVNVNLSNKVRLRARQSAKYGINRYAYPNVMGVIAELWMDDEKAGPDSFTLLAYSADGECRGTGKWVGEQMFLTLYGEGGEPLSFQAVDNLDGTIYAVREQAAFSPGVEGTVGEPFVLTIGEEAGHATQMASLPHGTAAVEGYYNLSGVRLSHRSAQLPGGLYLVKYKDGTYRKIIINK